MPTLANVVGAVVLAAFALMTVGGLGFLATGLRRAAEAWRLFAGSRTAAADVTADPWTMVRGTARPEDDPVVAPICGDEVVCADSRLEELRSSLRTPVWRPRYETTTTAAFRVDDGTGTVPVDPVEPTVATGDDRTVVRRPASPAAADRRVREFVAGAPDVDGVPAGDGVRYAESVVRPGDEVVVYGPVGPRDGRPAFGGGGDLTIATREPGAVLRDSAVSALVYGLLAAGLLTAPGLFVVFFLVPYLFGA